MAQQFWLFKSEPHVFSLGDLQQSPQKTTCWDGVRNYQARNLLRDAIHVGDGVLFYHSRVEPMAVLGLAQVVRAGYPDPSQFNAKHKYYDPQSNPDTPRWFAVDIRFDRTLPTPVTLQSMRSMPALADMVLLKKGSRLSVQPVRPVEWRAIVKAGGL